MNEELDKKLSLIHDDVLIIKERQAKVIETCQKHERTLYGNGQQGLVTQIALQRRESAILSAGIGLVVSAAIGWVFKGK